MNCSLCGSTNADEAVACAACGAALSPVGESSGDALPAGTTLQNGAFRIDAVLGQGGFGITYRGFDLSLQRSVAVKEFFPFGCRRLPAFDVQPSQSLSLSSYGTFKSRFVEEARVLARFKHPAIVDVYSVWEENNAAYMVMELLEGQTLEQVLHERNKPLDESEVLALAQRIGEVLSEVHRRGLLHRDIKPANIVQCDDGRVMLIDFGTAREYSKDAHSMQGHSIVVTPGYAPLEQYAERATRGAYTDVYSLAATLYHLLTGEMPPAASDRALGVELRPAHELNPQVSPTVSAALSCAMETQVARRPQSVDEFLAMLHGQRAAALAPQSSTGLARATGEALDFPEKTSNKNLSVNKEYERPSVLASEKLAALHRIGVDKEYERPSEIARENATTLSHTDVIEARQQLLNSLPPSPHAPSIGNLPKDAFAALVASQGASNSSLQQTSASSQSLFPPPSANDLSVQVRKDSPSTRHSWFIWLGFWVIIVVLCAFILSLRHSQNTGRQFTSPTYNSQPTTEPASAAYDFLRSQNLEPQKPFANRELPGLNDTSLNTCQLSASGKILAVSEGPSPKIHIYDFPSLRPICVLPTGHNTSVPKLSADGSLLAMQAGENTQLWNTKTGKQKFSWPMALQNNNDPRGFDISPDGQFVIGTPTTSTIAAWSTETGKQLFQIQAPNSFSPFVFTQDSKQWISFFQATASETTAVQLQRHELRTGKTIATKNLPFSRQVALPQLLSNNRLVASGLPDSAVIDLESPSLPVQTISDIAPSAWRNNLQSWPLMWSSDGRFVLGVSNSNISNDPPYCITFIRKFDPEILKPTGIAVLSTPVEQEPWGNTLQIPSGGMFSRDNKFLYVISRRGKLLTWRLDQLQWR